MSSPARDLLKCILKAGGGGSQPLLITSEKKMSGETKSLGQRAQLLQDINDLSLFSVVTPRN